MFGVANPFLGDRILGQLASGNVLCARFILSNTAIMACFHANNAIRPVPNGNALILLVLGIGVLGTAFAYPLYFKVLELAGASNLLLVTIIVPVFALILDALLLGQWVSQTCRISDDCLWPYFNRWTSLPAYSDIKLGL